MRVKGRVKSGLIICKYASGLTGLSQLRKRFLESDRFNPKRGGDWAFLSRLRALSGALILFRAPYVSYMVGSGSLPRRRALLGHPGL